VSSAAFREVISAAPGEKLDLFLTTANRLGAPIGNIEKDFGSAGPSTPSITNGPPEVRASCSRAGRRCRRLSG